ncbi:MFS transporter [Micromonospora sp. DT62]|uniref:MFS transporter n=1 Tax=Micromonospora sp. DT62 TaxID=3416521 RepID=UPI003CF2F6F6
MRLLSAVRAQVPDGPARILAVNQFISSVGLGAFITGSALFYVRFIGLTPAQVGIGASVAGVCGLLLTVPMGRLADRIGPRELGIGLALAEAALVLAYVWIGTFAAFLVVISLLAAVEKSAGVVRNAMLVGLLGREGRIAIKALMRSLFNAGFSVGALLAALPLHSDSRLGYLTLVIGYSAATFVTALLMLRLPRVAAPHAGHGKQPWTAVRDWRYLGLAVTCGSIAVHNSVLVVALPLWISGSTRAPLSVYSVLLVLNTVMVVALQVRCARGATTVAGSVGLIRRGGLVLVLACALFAAARFGPREVSVAALVAGVVTLTLAELWIAAGSWTLSFELADPGAPGEYQGAFALGMSVESVLGPVLAVGVVTALGVPGWALLAGWFLALAVVVQLLVRAQRGSRPPEVAAEPVPVPVPVR